MSETETPVDETPGPSAETPYAEPDFPGRCTKCGARVVPSVARADGTMFHQRQRISAKGLPRKGAPVLCGHVLTQWVYFVVLRWERPSATGLQGGLINHQVALRHPIEDITQVRQLEQNLAGRIATPAPAEGPQLVGVGSEARVRIENWILLRAQ